jgi:hypothetical protein
MRPKGPSTPSRLRSSAIARGDKHAALATHWLARCVVTLDHVVTVAEATAGLARLDAAAHTAPGLVGEVLEEERIHGTLEADV